MRSVLGLPGEVKARRSENWVISYRMSNRIELRVNTNASFSAKSGAGKSDPACGLGLEPNRLGLEPNRPAAAGVIQLRPGNYRFEPIFNPDQDRRRTGVRVR